MGWRVCPKNICFSRPRRTFVCLLHVGGCLCLPQVWDIRRAQLRLNGSAFLWVPGIERAYDEPVRSFTFLARSVLSNISFRVVSPTRLMRGAAACTGLSTRIGGAGGTPAGGSAEADILVIYQFGRCTSSRSRHKTMDLADPKNVEKVSCCIRCSVFICAVTVIIISSSSSSSSAKKKKSCPTLALFSSLSLLSLSQRKDCLPLHPSTAVPWQFFFTAPTYYHVCRLVYWWWWVGVQAVL